MRAMLMLAATLALWPATAAPSPAIWIWPMPHTCTMPASIRLVGASFSGEPDTLGTFTIVIRDLGYNPWPYADLLLDFGAVTDVAICPVQAPGLLARVQSRTIEARTDAAGVLRVAVLGHAIPGAPASPPNSVRVWFRTNSPFYGDIDVGRTSCSAFDLNGGGMSGSDFALWLRSFVSGANPALSDYDADGVVKGADLSLWFCVFFYGGSTVACPAVVTGPGRAGE
jgi:hypothetical protein